MAGLTMVEALNKALDKKMESDDRVCVLGEDVGVDGGVFRVTRGLIDKYGEDRVLDTPLAECGIIATAVGMAVYGQRPVAEIQFSRLHDAGVRPDRAEHGPVPQPLA